MLGGDPASSGAIGFVRFGIRHLSHKQKGAICGEDL